MGAQTGLELRCFIEWLRIVRWRNKLKKQKDHARTKIDNWVQWKRLADTPLEYAAASDRTPRGIAELISGTSFSDIDTVAYASPPQQQEVHSPILPAVSSPGRISPRQERNAHLLSLYLSDPR